MNKRYNLFLVFSLLVAILTIPIKSYAYSSVDEAISWAEDEIGSNWDASCGHKWAWWCMHFLGHCYDQVPSGVYSAIDGWNGYDWIFGNREYSFPPPAGALVFFEATAKNGWDGHVGLSLGNGQMIHAWTSGVRQDDIKFGGNYLGWRWPLAWTPDNPSDPPENPDGNLSIDKVQGSKEGKDDWANSFELSMVDIYDMDFRAKLEQKDGAWPSDTEAYFYLSLDKDLDSGDIFLGSEERDLTKEKAKKKSIYLKDVDMADYISSPGTYYVLTKVKFDGGKKESSPGDSKERVKITVIDTSVPDLTVQSFQLNSGLNTITGGSPFGMKIAVQNIGTATAGSFQIRYQMKGPGTGNVWQFIGEKNFDAGQIAPDATVWDSTNDSFAIAPAAEGEYQLQSCVDSTGIVTESNEGNNCAEVGVYITKSPAPDLVAHSLQLNSGESSLVGGSLYGLSVIVGNIGNRPVDTNFQIIYQINGPSTDKEWMPIGESSFTAIPLNSNSSELRSTSDQFASAPGVAGYYQIRSCVDSEGIILESDEENNCSEEVTIEVLSPEDSSLKPVYRFYSSEQLSHFYTISEEEKNRVIEMYTPEQWKYERVAWYAHAFQEDDSVPVYRFYSSPLTLHRYTISEEEKNTLLSQPDFYKYEGIAWYVYTYQKAGTVPVYRFYSDTYQSYFYTISEAERDIVIDKYPDEIWRYDGIAWYVFPASNPAIKPVYRFYSSEQLSHFYTISEKEKNTVIEMYTPEQWKYERVAWCAHPYQESDSVPVYRFYSSPLTLHRYTISEEEKSSLLAMPETFRYEGIAWYAYTYQKDGTVPVYRFYSDTYQSYFYTISEAERDLVIEKYPDEIWRYDGISWYVFECP